MEADRCVRRGDVMLLGKVPHALLFKINSTKDLRIFQLQTFDDAVETSANFVLLVARWLGRGF